MLKTQLRITVKIMAPTSVPPGMPSVLNRKPPQAAIRYMPATWSQYRLSSVSCFAPPSFSCRCLSASPIARSWRAISATKIIVRMQLLKIIRRLCITPTIPVSAPMSAATKTISVAPPGVMDSSAVLTSSCVVRTTITPNTTFSTMHTQNISAMGTIRRFISLTSLRPTRLPDMAPRQICTAKRTCEYINALPKIMFSAATPTMPPIMPPAGIFSRIAAAPQTKATAIVITNQRNVSTRITPFPPRLQAVQFPAAAARNKMIGKNLFQILGFMTAL